MTTWREKKEREQTEVEGVREKMSVIQAEEKGGNVSNELRVTGLS